MENEENEDPLEPPPESLRDFENNQTQNLKNSKVQLICPCRSQVILKNNTHSVSLISSDQPHGL